MTFPTIHRNGTSPKDLLEDVLAARSALCDAMTALRRVCPNGRDYYPQGPDAIQQAILEHTNRFGAIETVYYELGELAQSISDQEGNR